jgi:hypothetical protein
LGCIGGRLGVLRGRGRILSLALAAGYNAGAHQNSEKQSNQFRHAFHVMCAVSRKRQHPPFVKICIIISYTGGKYNRKTNDVSFQNKLHFRKKGV